MKKKVYVGADHAGFKLKEKIKNYLGKIGFDVVDLGGDGVAGDDYPDYAFAVAKKVISNKGSRGILICGTGTGMVMAVNKVHGVRAMVGYDKYGVLMGRRDNDANVLCLRGRKFSPRKNLKLVDSWLGEEFSGKDRHKRRLRKIERGR
jgi:RpiB/LacA/LacB family sugar-phosphate isomerase